MAFSLLNLPAKVPSCESTVLGRLGWHAIAAHEQLLIDQLLKDTHRSRLVQPAFVATDGGPAAYIWKW